MSNINYRFSPSLLNLFQDYLSSDDVWKRYWGRTSKPKKSKEEFKLEKFNSLLNYLNKVKQEPNFYADRGTAFNELIDSIIHGVDSTKISIDIEGDKNFAVKLDSWTFYFPVKQCLKIAEKYVNPISQKRTEGVLETKYGKVLLFGYIDELLEDRVIDIKTLKAYVFDKFKDSYQHLVYLYCLHEEGIEVDKFDYDIYLMNELGEVTCSFIETYYYDKSNDEVLRQHCEKFIEFLEENKELITDKKIFNVFS